MLNFAEIPETVKALVEILLDAPLKINSIPSNRAVSQSQEKLESVSVSARLGIGKLHAPKSQQRLNLYATKGKQQALIVYAQLIYIFYV